MKASRLLIALAVLAGLSVGVWYSTKDEKEKKDKPAPDAPPKLVKTAEADIHKIEVKRQMGELTVAEREGAGWKLTSPQPLRASDNSISSLVGALTAVVWERLMEEKAADLKMYGLDSPSMEVTWSGKDGKAAGRLIMGSDTPKRTAVYAKLDGDPRVFTLSVGTRTALDKMAKDLRDKRLLVFERDKLNQFEVAAKGQAIEFSKKGADWRITKPRELRADGFLVDELAGRLREIQMDTELPEEDTKKMAAAWPGAVPVATVKLAGQQLDVRRDPKDNVYYAKSSVIEGVHKVTNETGDAMNKSLDDYRNRKLFEFAFSDPTKVEIRDGQKTLAVSKNNIAWMAPGGKVMDTTAVQSVIDKLRDMAARKFVETGFTAAEIDVTVVSNEGKRTEKASFGKAGDAWIGRRENDPSLYEVDGKVVDELRKTVADVKEAPHKDVKK